VPADVSHIHPSLVRARSSGTLLTPFVNQDICLGFRYFLAFEAFLGILFANFCGGMFFLKTSRLHMRAYATFSSCMCLQFGQGVSEGDLYITRKSPKAADLSRIVSVRGLSCSYHEEEDCDGDAVKSPSNSNPFPVLMFRLVNDVRIVNFGLKKTSLLKKWDSW
jgi:hypothetical protein